MQGRLFGRSLYETLLAQETTAGLLRILGDSPYCEALAITRPQFPAAAARAENGEPSADHGAWIDEALRWDLTQSLSKLRRFASDRARDLLEALLLRWDAYNLKTIVRGKRAAAPAEEILASTFPVGILDEVALAELTRMPTIRALGQTLETWRVPLAQPFRRGVRLLEEADQLQPLEFELDRFTFAQGFRVLADGGDDEVVLREYLRLLVDKTNLLTSLRYLSERSPLSPIEAGRHFLEAGGRFSRAQYEAVVRGRDLRHGLSLLAGSPYGWLAGSFADGEIPSLSRLERKLDHAVGRKAVHLARHDPLGIGMAVAYVEQKTNEVRNLRMILRGRALGMNADQVVEWLII